MKKEYKDKISGMIHNQPQKTNKAPDKYAKRVIELPEKHLKDLKYLQMIEEKTQRDLIEMAIYNLIEAKKDEIAAIKKALGKK